MAEGPLSTNGGTVLLGGRLASSALVRREPRFGPLKARFGPARVEVGRDPFASIVEAITHQQLSIAAGRTVYSRVEALCRDRVAPDVILRAGPERLRTCGLSRPKVGFVLDLAGRVEKGDVALDACDRMTDDEVVGLLTSIKGIGVWTAQMLLIFTLHRPDVMPSLDLGVQDGARIVLGLRSRPTPQRLERLSDPWRPYRSVASWYLWRERDPIVRGHRPLP